MAFIVAIPLGQQHLSINIAPALGADPSAGDAGVSVVVDQSGGRTQEDVREGAGERLDQKKVE